MPAATTRDMRDLAEPSQQLRRHRTAAPHYAYEATEALRVEDLLKDPSEEVGVAGLKLGRPESTASLHCALPHAAPGRGCALPTVPLHKWRFN